MTECNVMLCYCEPGMPCRLGFVGQPNGIEEAIARDGLLMGVVDVLKVPAAERMNDPRRHERGA